MRVTNNLYLEYSREIDLRGGIRLEIILQCPKTKLSLGNPEDGDHGVISTISELLQPWMNVKEAFPRFRIV